MTECAGSQGRFPDATLGGHRNGKLGTLEEEGLGPSARHAHLKRKGPETEPKLAVEKRKNPGEHRYLNTL